MKNKRAQFMGAFMVIMTLFLCGVVVMDFYIKGDNTSSLVSPRIVLEVRDDLDIFEMREADLIKSSLTMVSQRDGGIDFCSEEFSDKFKEEFVSGVLEDVRMKEFIFENLILDGEKIDADQSTFLENVLYSEGLGECSDNKRVFSRSEIGKMIRLRVPNKANINFPVDFVFEFKKEYSILKVNEKYVVE